MKKIICEKYKIINLALLVSISSLVLGIYLYVMQGHCINNCSLEIKKGIINPFYSGGVWLSGILAALLLFPARLFRTWLLYIAPPILLLTFWLVQGISVHSGNLLNPTRAKMAENGMMLLALITMLFLITSLILERRKKSKLPTA